MSGANRFVLCIASPEDRPGDILLIPQPGPCLPAPITQRLTPQICGGAEAKFQSSVPYTVIFFWRFFIEC